MNSYWSFESNSLIENSLNKEYEDLEKNFEKYVQSKNLKKDFLAYCNLMNILPHPKLLQIIDESKEENLTEIKLRNWKLDFPNQIALFYNLPYCNNLTTLCFFNADLTIDQIKLIVSKLPSTSIINFSLEWNPLDLKENISIFGDLIGKDSSLQELSLRANNITSEAMEFISEALALNKKLKSLNLFGNKIQDKGIHSLAYALHQNRNLFYLSLSDNEISNIGALEIIESITKYKATKKDLEVIAQKEESLLTLKKKKVDREHALQELNLHIPLIEVIDGEKYCSGNGILQYLNLGSNRITDEIEETLSLLLRNHQKILGEDFKGIRFERNPLSLKALENLKNSLERVKTIE